MEIQGLQKMTLLDYPGKVACTVFLGWCDFRCPFCHNGELVLSPALAEMNQEELAGLFEKAPGSAGRGVHHRRRAAAAA